MIRRPRRSLPAALVAAVLLAVCVLVIVAVAQSLLGQTPFLSLAQLLAVSGSQRWNSAAVVAVAIVVALLGLVLLVVALRPGKPTVIPLARYQWPDGAPAADAGVRRHTLAKDLQATAAAVPGVTHASVTARRSVVVAQVRVAAADPAAVPEQLRERLTARLTEIGPAPCPKVRVRARADKNS